MSGYCTTEDIKADFKSLALSDSSAVTTAQVEKWIAAESAYIDGRIGLRYVTPVAIDEYPEAALILKRICVFRVSELVRNVIEVKTNSSQKDSAEKYRDNYVRTPNDDIDLIAKGLLLLKGAPLVSKEQGVSSFNVDACVPHTFDVNKQQW